jgi:glycosyltransferase involved in cell wall biosynthesis
MRILHAGKYYPPFRGGIENFLADLVGAQVTDGNQVAVVAHNHQRGGVWAVDSNPLIDRVPCHGQLLYAPLSPSYPLWLERRLRQFDPDLIHIHMPNTSAFWLLFSPAARRRPWVVHWHADVVTSAIDRRLQWAYPLLYRPFEQWLLSRASTIIVTSPPYLEASEPLSRWRSRCRVVPLGIDERRLATVEPQLEAWAERQWQNDQMRILGVGRMTYYKGQSTLIDAVAATAGCQLRLVGRGELAETVAKRATDPALEGRVAILDRCDDRQLAALLASCDLLALPSLERTEAFGVVLLEAMALGKALVVSDIPGSGTGWVVEQGQCGWRTTPGSVNDWAQTLASIRDQPAERCARGTEGRSRFDQLFSIRQTAMLISDCYRALGCRQ